jgi:hypothetical protein
LFFEAVPGDMALLLTVKAASFGKQLSLFILIHCIDFDRWRGVLCPRAVARALKQGGSKV